MISGNGNRNRSVGGFLYRSLLQLIFIFLFIFHGIGQQADSLLNISETDISDKIENIAENSDAVIDYTELIEGLKFFKENPLNLNFADEDDLRQLTFLNNMQIFNLIAYRETYGNFVTIFELNGIDGFDEETILKILPYIIVSEVKPKISLTPKKIIKYGRHDLFLRYQRILQEQKGYSAIDDSSLLASPNSRYLGSPDKFYLRYGFRYSNKIRFGFTAEKDAGEAFFLKNSNDSIRKLAGPELKQGFDFMSYHLHINDIGFLKSLSIGDYQLRFGQGLTMWSGLAFGKSADALNLKKQAVGIKPYTSTDENRYFRGAAATFELWDFELSAFYSSHKIDASLNLENFEDNEEAYFSSLQETGLHRTTGELSKKKALGSKVYGGNLNYSNSRLRIGFIAFLTQFDVNLKKDLYPYNKFDFTGSELSNAGFNYSYLFDKVNVFGELALSDNGGFAQIHGFTANLHPQLGVSMIYRDYRKTYHNFYSNALAEGSYNRNERGLYTGLKLNLHAKWSISCYIDSYKFPWLKYNVDRPSGGNEILVQADYYLSGSVLMYFRFRQKSKQVNEAGIETYTQNLQNEQKSNFRFHLEYAISPSIVLKNRVEYLFLKDGNNKHGNGYLLYQDIAYRPPLKKLSMAFRYSLFDTDSYNERIYAYENDILYAFSVPGYYYKGSRTYLLLKYEITDRIDCWFRISHTYISNKRTIGTALDEIDGNTKSEVKFQVRIRI